MNRIDERTVQALVALKDNRDFEVFREWIRKSFADQCISINTIQDETALRWRQGENKCLHEIIKSIADAREMLEKVRNKETRRPD